MTTTSDAAQAKKRPPSAGKGREKGVPNKTTRVLKEAILEAAEAVGENGRGKDGLVGYLKQVARKDRKAFATLLGRVLPLQLSGPNGGPVPVAAVSCTPEEFQKIASAMAREV